MIKNKLILLIPIISLITSCSSEPLFFTGKVATEEEKIAFFSKVSDNYAFIPDGWYEYESKMLRNDNIRNQLNVIFYVESTMGTNFVTYKFPKIKGKIVRDDGSSEEYLVNDDGIRVKQIPANGEQIILGGTNVSIDLTNNNNIFTCFNSIKDTYYIKNNSFHCEFVKDRHQWHIGFEYNDNFTKIKKGKLYIESLFKDYLNYTSYSIATIKSCDEIDIAIEGAYDKDISHLDNYYIIYNYSL